MNHIADARTARGERDRLLAPATKVLTYANFAWIHGITVASIFVLPGLDRRWVSGIQRRGSPIFAAWVERTNQTPPLIADILSSLASHAAAVETSTGAEEWSENVGLSTGQNVKKMYLTARMQAKRLRAWLPVGSYETLLWDITKQ